MSQELLDLMIQDEVIGKATYYVPPDLRNIPRLVLWASARLRLYVYLPRTLVLSGEFVEACWGLCKNLPDSVQRVGKFVTISHHGYLYIGPKTPEVMADFHNWLDEYTETLAWVRSEVSEKIGG